MPALAVLLLLLSGNSCAQNKQVSATSGEVNVETLADHLDHPWGMAFLPDGRLLVTERAGQLRILRTDNTLTPPLEGVPEVFAQGQGGLLDVALDPDFATNQHVYLSFAEPGANQTASTALGRGRLDGNRISGFEVIYRQLPKVEGPNHFGGRILFSPAGQVFLTQGERFKFEPAQNLSNHLGTIVRLQPDGSVPADNPFVNQPAAKPEIWSYGHRNIEAAAFDPATGRFWVAEMGPRGGDELNQPQAGRNYGWPVVSWGENYDGTDIPDPPTHPEFAAAALHWTPVISPSGMAFYDGSEFPAWQGKMLIGGLTAQGIVVVDTSPEKPREVDRLELGMRIRDIAQAPDGSIYALTDAANGRILRLRKP